MGTEQEHVSELTSLNFRTKKMQKIILASVLAAICVCASSREASRIQRLRKIIQILELANSQLGELDDMAQLDQLTEMDHLSARDEDFLSRYGRQSRSMLCATVVGHKCIPPCRKYHGKVGRSCNPQEKQEHLMYYLFLKK